MRFVMILLALFMALHTSTAHSDELRPVYIQLDQQTDSQWQLIWQASSRSTLGRNGEVILPESCQIVGNVNRSIIAGNVRRTSTVECSQDLVGQSIGLLGLEYSSTDALVRIAPINAELLTMRLTPSAPQAQIEPPSDSVINNVALTYTVIGVEHIVFGFDHLLFVLALVLLLKGWKTIAIAVTAFTLSHSITLVGTTLGAFSLPSRPVEAIIALSIVFLAAEILKSKPNQLRLSEQYPWLVAFAFGLLHGFGFAGALADIGLPSNDRPLALFAFNLGVELGQLVIVAIALLVLNLMRKYTAQMLRPTKVAMAYGIGIISTFWLIERVI